MIVVFYNRRKSFLKILLISAIVSVGIGGMIYIFANLTNNNNISKSKIPGILPNKIEKTSEIRQVDKGIGITGQSIISVANSTMPAVVGISVLKVDSGLLFDKNATEKWGIGSGVLVSSNGYILTNYHVAGDKNKEIIVSLYNGKNVNGVTVWADSVIDLAIVKIDMTDLPTIPIGDSSKLQVGELAIAIGNPLGLQFQRTVTSGIISALNRTIQIDTEQGTNYMEGLIQTDASINPGNSGGPLLNALGEVIGVNTVKVASAEAIGFAVPINIVVPVLKQYIDNNTFSEAYLGIFAYDKELIPFIDGIDMKADKGIYIVNIDKLSPAYKSGLDKGCLITQVDGRDINTMLELRTYLYSKRPGEAVNITCVSQNEQKSVNIILSAKEKDGLVTR